MKSANIFAVCNIWLRSKSLATPYSIADLTPTDLAICASELPFTLYV
jgi:hypothetical protein